MFILLTKDISEYILYITTINSIYSLNKKGGPYEDNYLEFFK